MGSWGNYAKPFNRGLGLWPQHVRHLETLRSQDAITVRILARAWPLSWGGTGWSGGRLKNLKSFLSHKGCLGRWSEGCHHAGRSVADLYVPSHDALTFERNATE